MLLNISNAFNPTNKSQLTRAVTVHSNTRYVEPQKSLISLPFCHCVKSLLRSVNEVCILLHSLQCMHCLVLFALHCIALYCIPVGSKVEIAFALGKMLSQLVDSLLNTGILTSYDSGSLLLKFVLEFRSGWVELRVIAVISSVTMVVVVDVVTVSHLIPVHLNTLDWIVNKVMMRWISILSEFSVVVVLGSLIVKSVF